MTSEWPRVAASIIPTRASGVSTNLKTWGMGIEGVPKLWGLKVLKCQVSLPPKKECQIVGCFLDHSRIGFSWLRAYLESLWWHTYYIRFGIQCSRASVWWDKACLLSLNTRGWTRGPRPPPHAQRWQQPSDRQRPGCQQHGLGPQQPLAAGCIHPKCHFCYAPFHPFQGKTEIYKDHHLSRI